MPGKIFFGLNDLARRLGHAAQHADISKRFAAGHQQVFDELHALPVWKRKLLLQEQGRAVKNRAAATLVHGSLHQFYDLRRFFNTPALRRQHIIQQHDHRLPFQHGAFLVIPYQPIQVFQPALFNLIIVLAHLFQVEALVLERMGKLMGHHRTLHLRLIPVEQVHGAGLLVIVAGHLFGKQFDKKTVQIEGTRQEPKFFLHELRALKADAVSIVVEFVADVFFHLWAADDGPLDLFLDRQAGIFAGKTQNLIHRAEKFFGFRRSDLVDFFNRLNFNAVARWRAWRLCGLRTQLRSCRWLRRN